MSTTGIVFLSKEDRTLLRLLSEASSVEDTKGFATRKLIDMLESNQLSMPPDYYLRVLDNFGFIERDVKGKRTYSISITPLGRQALEWIDSLIEDQDLSKVNTLDIASELYSRALAADNPDHSACEEEISNLNNRLAIVDRLMSDFEDGNRSWLEVAPQIIQAIRPSTESSS